MFSGRRSVQRGADGQRRNDRHQQLREDHLWNRGRRRINMRRGYPILIHIGTHKLCASETRQYLLNPSCMWTIKLQYWSHTISLLKSFFFIKLFRIFILLSNLVLLFHKSYFLMEKNEKLISCYSGENISFVFFRVSVLLKKQKCVYSNKQQYFVIISIKRFVKSSNYFNICLQKPYFVDIASAKHFVGPTNILLNQQRPCWVPNSTSKTLFKQQNPLTKLILSFHKKQFYVCCILSLSKTIERNLKKI